jgi:hypothetical protein
MDFYHLIYECSQKGRDNAVTIYKYLLRPGHVVVVRHNKSKAKVYYDDYSTGTFGNHETKTLKYDNDSKEELEKLVKILLKMEILKFSHSCNKNHQIYKHDLGSFEVLF